MAGQGLSHHAGGLATRHGREVICYACSGVTDLFGGTVDGTIHCNPQDTIKIRHLLLPSIAIWAHSRWSMSQCHPLLSSGHTRDGPSIALLRTSGHDQDGRSVTAIHCHAQETSRARTK
eukprot:1159635-Pelagomonas_calceolata.AAC.5